MDGSKAKILRQALMVLASLVIAALGIDLIRRYRPGILGVHGTNIPAILPICAVASYYLIDLLLAALRRGRGAGGDGALPGQRFSWLPLASLILSSAGFFLPFVSIGGIVAGHAARRQHQKGPGLRGKGMANVGLITGYLFLSIWTYMFVMILFFEIYAIFFGRG